MAGSLLFLFIQIEEENSAEASATETACSRPNSPFLFSIELGLQGHKSNVSFSIIAPHLKITSAEIGSDLLCQRTM
jgi:hypothetical protein